MENKLVKCGKLSISNTSPFTLIAGPCQLENEKHALDVAAELKKITEKIGVGLIYKTSFDNFFSFMPFFNQSNNWCPIITKFTC